MNSLSLHHYLSLSVCVSLPSQSELVDLARSIQEKLSYFNELENINTVKLCYNKDNVFVRCDVSVPISGCFSLQKLNSSTLSVNSEGFIPMLSKLDECVEYVSSHVSKLVYTLYNISILP